MDYRNNKNIDPWDDGVYGTGNTMPPKNHSGIVAVLVIMVIFLSGVVSVLSFLNVQLFQQLSQEMHKQQQTGPVSISGPEQVTAPAFIDREDPQNITQDISISLNRSPQSVDNVPEMGALSWQEIYEKNLPSVVAVLSSTGGGEPTGTGVIVSEKGYIVTTFQAVHDSETITIRFSDGETISAILVGADPVTDLAVLYASREGLVPAEFGDSEALRVGDSVSSIGDPTLTQSAGTLTPGIVAAINRDIPFLGQNINLLQTSVPPASGNSGSPVINCYGQVVGIHTACIGDTELLSRIGFAIPSTTVKDIVDQLISQGYVSGRPTLGLTGESITRFDQHYFHVPAGLYLTEVDPDSDAGKLGFAPGDILIRVGGKNVTSQSELDTVINALSIGDRVSAVFYREGKEQTVSLTVMEYTG